MVKSFHGTATATEPFQMNAPAEEVLVVPASYAQQRLWFIEQLTPGTSTYHVCATISFPDPLNFSALLDSLNEIVRRHEALRTVFTSLEGHSMQVIRPAQTVLLPTVSLTDLPQ